MMIIIWLLFGIVAVATAFLIPGHGPELWPNINLAGITAAGYLFLLTAFTVKKPFTRSSIFGVWFILVLTTFMVYRSWRATSDLSHWQRHELHKTANSLGQDVISSETQMTLLRILDMYYQQAPEERRNLAKIFQQIFPGALVGKNIHPEIRQFLSAYEPYTTDRTKIILKSISDTLIVLAGKARVGGGLNPLFANFDSTSGHPQGIATLTLKGVRYDIEN